MTIHTRPDEKVFASGAKPGEMVDFPDIERGWGLAFEQTEGKPPMEWMNGAFLRLNEAVRYFMQRGLPEWSATEDYPAGAFVQHSQKMYKSLLANTDVVPGTAAATWDPVVSDASTTTKGMIEIATATEAKALADALRAITPTTLGAVLADQGFIKPYTFAQAVALTEDVGPISVIGMDGIWEWTETAFFTGYRHPHCGEWMDGWTPQPLPFQIEAIGGTWTEADPKHARVIARYRESGLVVPIGSWIAKQNKIADLGGGNWKAADLRDVFKRMTGTDADTANARLLGAWKSDALRSHSHSINFSPSATNTPDTLGGVQHQVSFTTTATSTPTGGAETRPESSAVTPFVHI